MDRSWWAQLPEKILESSELVMQSTRPREEKGAAPAGAGDFSWTDWQLVSEKRAPGKNKVGMVAWDVTIYTPEAPAGRRVILIANDITFMAGTFGPEEDVLFYLASRRARELVRTARCPALPRGTSLTHTRARPQGVPRLYIAANSGARIGLADELLRKFRVGWVGGDPLKGLQYLYLNEAEYSGGIAGAAPVGCLAASPAQSCATAWCASAWKSSPTTRCPHRPRCWRRRARRRRTRSPATRRATRRIAKTRPRKRRRGTRTVSTVRGSGQRTPGLSRPSVAAAEPAKEVRYVLTDVIGRQNGAAPLLLVRACACAPANGHRAGLNVENLSGSGLIAGETSLAYDEVVTLSYVTGRTVGIGAYLVRLGQRVIQKRTGPQHRCLARPPAASAAADLQAHAVPSCSRATRR